MKTKKRRENGLLTVLLVLAAATTLLIISTLTPLKTLLYRVLNPEAYVESILLNTAAATYREARDYAVTNPVLRAAGAFSGKRTEAGLVFPAADGDVHKTARVLLDPVTRGLEAEFDCRAFFPEAVAPSHAVMYLSDETFGFTAGGETLVFPAGRFGESILAVLAHEYEDAVRYYGGEEPVSKLLKAAEEGVSLSYGSVLFGLEPAEETQKAVIDSLSELIAQSSIQFHPRQETAYSGRQPDSIIELRIPAPAVQMFLAGLIDKAESGGGAVFRLLGAMFPSFKDGLSVFKEELSSLEEPVTVELFETGGRIFAFHAGFGPDGERSCFLTLAEETPELGLFRIRAGYTDGSDAMEVDMESTVSESGKIELSGTLILGGHTRPFHVSWDTEAPGSNLYIAAEGARIFENAFLSLREEDGTIIFEYLPENGGGISIYAAPTGPEIETPPETARAGVLLKADELLARMGFLLPALLSSGSAADMGS